MSPASAATEPGIAPFDDNLAWEPSHGTEIVVMPLADPTKPIRFTVDPFFQWQLGNQVLVDNGEQRVLSWSRAPFVVLALVLAGLIVAWGRRMLGGAAAAWAMPWRATSSWRNSAAQLPDPPCRARS